VLTCPTLSVLILTHNRIDLSSNYIPKIVDSVGDIPFEVLLCDNGSIDGSCDWVYSYGMADCRVHKVVCLDDNLGVEATNILAEYARGKYILKVDDDVDVPKQFGSRLVKIYEYLDDPKIAFLGWDMSWNGGTFATRSGLKLYKPPMGKIVEIKNKGKVLISFNPNKWMINGVCRLSRKDTFLSLGGHPKGLKYGVDYAVSCAAAKQGYTIGYFSPSSLGDLVVHYGRDTREKRAWKDKELNRACGKKHV
jgi:glycosyltransferase involved in cell wall biosynthesis